MLKAFFRAVIAGTVAGTAFPVIILAIMILGSSSSPTDLRAMVVISLATVLIPLGLVVASAFTLGIPATFALKRLRWENEPAYLFVGAISGFVVPCAILAIAEGDPTVALRGLPAGAIGAFSGAITARSWWRSYREERANDS
jgi:hypothetical protein